MHKENFDLFDIHIFNKKNRRYLLFSFPCVLQIEVIYMHHHSYALHTLLSNLHLSSSIRFSLRSQIGRRIFNRRIY